MNWEKLISEIIESGLSEDKIAANLRDEKEIDISQSTIHRIKKGDITEPKHSVGEALKQLHLERCSEAAA